ncbi:MAG TPA: hypothetical protein PLO37_23835 [Candidatus Hydrogenedentes bacterium]|nr:hypothetical protein [Candidatus Hydrogenedentota bacterium]HPG69893.1 hypothetical protein [Candidatus Hydrogenedentota bacterium]
MLHDPSHYTPPPVVEEIRLSQEDKDVLRRLAQNVADIAALPIHAEKAGLWRRLNDLDSVRPMVWINEICWNEMNVDDELTLRCEHPWAQDQERELRQLVYQWSHLPADMILSDFLTCPLAIHSTSFGIVEDVDVVKMDETSDIMSRHFNIQIKELDDIEKIKMPVVTHNEKATEVRYQAMCEVYDGIMPVKKVGQTHIWFTPWDYLIRWWGVEEAMVDLVLRPDLVHAAVDRMVDAWMTELDQFVEQNLLALDCNNTRIGSGGYGYVSALPGVDYAADCVKPHNMWGCSNAQMFSEVSPEMHWEFAIEHDMRWLERWGLTYYGCCEPLDFKMDMLRRIPNLRKVSISPWCKPSRAVEAVGADYVMSHKPNPAILAEDSWDPEQARKNIRWFLDATEGQCHVELIMKDISTVRYRPQALWEWAAIAMEEVERMA